MPLIHVYATASLLANRKMGVGNLETVAAISFTGSSRVEHSHSRRGDGTHVALVGAAIYSGMESR